MIRDHLAVDGHPHPPIGAAAAVPEHLELEPLVNRHRVGTVVHPPEFKVGQAEVGYPVPCKPPEQRAVRLITTASVVPTVDASDHAIVIAGGLPLEESAPVLRSHFR